MKIIESNLVYVSTAEDFVCLAINIAGLPIKWEDRAPIKEQLEAQVLGLTI